MPYQRKTNKNGIYNNIVKMLTDLNIDFECPINNTTYIINANPINEDEIKLLREMMFEEIK